MIAVVRSEWIKLRSVRSNVSTAIVAVAIPLLITLLSVAFMGETSIDDSTLSDFVLGTGSIAVLLIGVIGVLCITQEYSQGTIRLTLAATPGRTKVYAGKALLMVIFGAALTGFIILVSLVVGSLILESRDVPGPHASMSAGLLAMVLMGALVALLGMAIGTLTRNPPSAITTLVLWPCSWRESSADCSASRSTTMSVVGCRSSPDSTRCFRNCPTMDSHAGSHSDISRPGFWWSRCWPNAG